MSNIFNTIKGNRQKKTGFNLSHDKKLSMKMGDLVPVLCEEVLPGDSWNIKTQSFIRFAPMIAPVMHKIDTYMHYFFVPNRIIFEGWEDFITGESDVPPPVYKDFIKFNKGGLCDYLGLPLSDDQGKIKASNISTMPALAYLKIYNEYYRDQNLEHEVIPDPIELDALRKRAWEKDYFTSALPWTQKGGEGLIPLDLQFSPQYREIAKVVAQGGGNPGTHNLQTVGGDLNLENGGDVGLHNLEEEQDHIAGEITINEFRIAHRIQKWFERQARAGSRYTETILSHFGTHTGDARLNRPEYLGGGKQPVVISEVLNTTGGQDLEHDEKVPQGHMSGHGISVGNTAKASKTFTEHGYVMCIMSVIPKTAYQDGVPKSFLRQDKFDYYWPEFAHLGEQEVKNIEIDFGDTLVNNNKTFGYQSRYAEYKYKQSTVHGDMRDDLSFYHMGRIFSQTPLLNKEFIECNMQEINDRIFAVSEGTKGRDQLWVQIHHNIIARRPMPYYGTPTI